MLLRKQTANLMTVSYKANNTNSVLKSTSLEKNMTLLHSFDNVGLVTEKVFGLCKPCTTYLWRSSSRTYEGKKTNTQMVNPSSPGKWPIKQRKMKRMTWLCNACSVTGKYQENATYSSSEVFTVLWKSYESNCFTICVVKWLCSKVF